MKKKCKKNPLHTIVQKRKHRPNTLIPQLTKMSYTFAKITYGTS